MGDRLRRLGQVGFFIAAFSSVVYVSALMVRFREQARETIRETHTRFLFDQIGNSSCIRGERLHLDDLASCLSQDGRIDWNSCSYSGRNILDGWGRVVNVQAIDDQTVLLQSKGRDGILETEDDIVNHISLRAEEAP